MALTPEQAAKIKRACTQICWCSEDLNDLRALGLVRRIKEQGRWRWSPTAAGWREYDRHVGGE